ncbi:AraC family transcriptional regulator [Duganella sp. LX20W]|uniref:AraC family transcriptional regulator n=1 Tax=Rugamonas brunnea TaxID=2758569 RepID=A0A7W2EX42_9BURK|nr:GyrI-like domain-containing protein [Rugamonas brunnea]MBA5640175.1 AraC family transcriptional regulator [Rugamonas brunnea]
MPTIPESPAASRAEYARRINLVLDYIDRHLDTPLELATLADVAHFSRFHFHRIFTAWMGETVGDYARRRRLEVAAFRLSRNTGETVLDIALGTGFGSGEAFARAFKLKFGCTPSTWRQATPARMAQQVAALGEHKFTLHSNLDQALGKPGQARAPHLGEDGHSHPTQGANSMEVQVIDLPPVRVAWQRRIGAYGPGIGAFWRDTMAPWMQSHGLMEQTCYGVGLDDPVLTPADKCRYDACVALPGHFQANGNTATTMLPGGRYAVARFRGPTTSIAAAWMTLTREWLPSSGLQCDERPCFERFHATTALDPATGEFTCDICIPVRPL